MLRLRRITHDGLQEGRLYSVIQAWVREGKRSKKKGEKRRGEERGADERGEEWRRVEWRGEEGRGNG